MAQFKVETGTLDPKISSHYEVVMLANGVNGNVVSRSNPLPVSLGADTITITGNTFIIDTVNVSSSPSNPVHNHITEVGTSGLLTVPYMPIGGNVNVTNVVTVTGNVTTNATITGTVLTNTESIYAAPWDMQVARGKVPDVIQVNIFGYTPNVTTTFHTIWENTPTDIVYPTVAHRLNVASTSSSDNSNASFLLTGVDGNWDPVSEIIHLNGTTPVTTSNTFMRINGMVMTSPGTGQNTNVGVVDVQWGVGNPIAQVNPGFGKMQNAFYSVPRGHGLYIQNINIFAGEANQGNQPIWFEYRVLTKNNKTGVQLTILQTPFAGEYKVQRFNPVKYSEMTDVQWQVKTNSGTHGAGVILEAVLIADTAP